MVSEGGDLPNLVNSIKHSAKTLDKWDYEWRILDKSGQVRWHHGIGIPVKKPDGTVIWDSLVMDVTERKHLEYLLEQSARMAKIGSWEIDARNEPYFLSWSSTTAEIVESTLDGVPLEDGFKVYAEEYQGQVRQGMYDLLREGKPFDQELLLTTGKGSLKWIRCLGQAQIFEGKVIRAFGSFQDIHDRKIAELELKRLLLERNDILESIGDGFLHSIGIGSSTIGIIKQNFCSKYRSKSYWGKIYGKYSIRNLIPYPTPITIRRWRLGRLFISRNIMKNWKPGFRFRHSLRRRV